MRFIGRLPLTGDYIEVYVPIRLNVMIFLVNQELFCQWPPLDILYHVYWLIRNVF